MTGEVLPRRFGSYLLTAFLGEDALGRVFRGMRMSGERVFTRVRILEGPEISEDAVVDSIEENGEIHTFLKNPAIARGVQLDAVEGTPYIAWNEESGRTLDALLGKVRDLNQRIPYEHALLIVEKVATALDHAYNTTVDGERTLHGLVWPGFVSISDDGETRLTGFGLASGFLPSLGRPRFAKEIGPYLAPEEKASSRIGKNSDVYSVGAILFELLLGRLPNPADPIADLRTAQRDGAPIAPEAAAVLRMCLGPAEGRFQSSGELRRELGKLLFSGPYSPSTFNLAFFLNGLFALEIEAESRARSAEASLDPSAIGPAPAPQAPAAAPPARERPAPLAARDRTPTAATMAPRPSTRPIPRDPPPAAPRRRGPPFVLGGALLVTAAVAGTAWLVLRRAPAPRPAPARAATRSPVPVTPTAAPPPAATGPTTAMSDAQFKDEVARRVGAEMKKMEQDMRRTAAADARAAAVAAAAAAKTRPAAGKAAARSENPAAASAAAGTPAEAPPPTAAPARITEVEPTPAPAPEAAAPAGGAPAAASPADVEIPPKILRIVKPVYPQAALRARIGGIVLLRVLVSETGVPAEVQVLKSVSAGLTESAVSAVRGWRFEPATRGGIPVRGWTTIPIPFQP